MGDSCLVARDSLFSVIPAQAGIHYLVIPSAVEESILNRFLHFTILSITLVEMT